MVYFWSPHDWHLSFFFLKKRIASRIKKLTQGHFNSSGFERKFHSVINLWGYFVVISDCFGSSSSRLPCLPAFSPFFRPALNSSRGNMSEQINNSRKEKERVASFHQLGFWLQLPNITVSGVFFICSEFLPVWVLIRSAAVAAETVLCSKRTKTLRLWCCSLWNTFHLSNILGKLA